MTVHLPVPLLKEAVARLRAGDPVMLSGPLLVVDSRGGPPDVRVENWLVRTGQTSDGWVCCLAVAPVVMTSSIWTVARIDEPPADRVACALLAAGSRGLVCRGRCTSTTSYALRKYGGVCFGAPEDWLTGRDIEGAAGATGAEDWPAAFLVTMRGAAVTVTHDVLGRQVEIDG